MLLPTAVLIQRLDRDNPTADKEGFVTASGVGSAGYAFVNIQPASAELTALSEGEVFKTYLCFTTISGIAEPMRLTVSGTQDTYIVRGREVYNYGANTHYELTLAKDKV